MKKMICLLTLAFSVFAVNAQDCSKGGQFKQGVTYTTTSYDKKDKVQGSNKATCTAVTTTGDATVANMKSEGFDKDGKSTGSTEFTITCKKGIIYIDMRSMAGNNEAFKDATMTMEGDNLEMPQTMTPGQTLPDAKVKMTFTKDGVQSGSMDMIIRNRKVEAKETITTSAGTFECYKISFEVETQMAMNMGTMNMPMPKTTVKSVTWYNADAGSVRNESYRGDKLMGYSVLTEIKAN